MPNGSLELTSGQRAYARQLLPWPPRGSVQALGDNPTPLGHTGPMNDEHAPHNMNELPGDATRVAFPNSGLVLFVYDDANADAIRTANPSILEGFGEDDINDPALARLGAEGLLVVVELEQDDDVRLQLTVRDPLNDEERGDDWGPSDRAMISLPSGTLKIEGYDNLRIAPDVFDDAEPGGTVHVPPGRYALSFYWRPLDAAEAVRAESPRHLIILTPAEDVASVSSGAAFLTPVPRQA